MTYIYNPIEDYVKKLYQKLSINVPGKLDMIGIATKLDVALYFESIASKAIQIEEKNFIFIDDRLTYQQQWQEFGHELCHVLMHYGNQLHLPSEFILYQENKAKNFAQHFCIPTFMLEQLDLPPRMQEALELITKTFNVELDFAKTRLKKWIHQKQSFDFYEKVAESSTIYESDEDSHKVVYLGSDVNDLPAPPEVIEKVFKQLKIESFSCRDTITIGLLEHLKEECKRFNAI